MKTLKTLVSWVEIPVGSMERAKRFYETILEIKLHETKFDNGLIMAFFPVEPNGIGGALCQMQEEYKPSAEGVVIYLSADPDIETIISKVVETGGVVLQKRKQISDNPEFGFMALIIDTEGNRIALYEK